jgi:hypothetical protein
MTIDGEDFRFTEEGWARREALLREAEDRIERERFEPPDASNLSDAARALLRRRLAGDREVTDANRAIYRELAAARIMMPVHSFLGGQEADFHFTYWGWARRFEFAEMDCAENEVLGIPLPRAAGDDGMDGVVGQRDQVSGQGDGGILE